MSGMAPAPFLADQAGQATVEIVENVELARDTWRVRFRFPELAAKITPGQFVMLRLAGYNDSKPSLKIKGTDAEKPSKSTLIAVVPPSCTLTEFE